MQITYKFRLYPSKENEKKLLETLDKCRFVYNKLLEGLNNQEKPNRLELQNSIPKLKEEYQELKRVYSKALQYECYRLFSNLKALCKLKKNGKKVGKLRYKSQGVFKTFTYNQSGFKIIFSGKRCQTLCLSKIGEIPIRMHRTFKGNIKQITIKKEHSGKWFANLIVEKEIKTESKPKGKIGIDMGIKHFITDTEGRQIENPKFYEKTLERIKIEQRKLSKKKKDSRNRERQKIRLARAYEKLVNKRDDFLHKLSKFYSNYEITVVEELNIKSMTRNHNLAQKILDASWDKFLRMLSYKAERAGGRVVKVNPRGTSKEYNFGELDRDYNASLNILQRGLEKLGMGQAKVTPVERKPLLKTVSCKEVVSGQVFSMNQEAPCESWE